MQATFCESEATAHFHPAGKAKSLHLHREVLADNAAVAAIISMAVYTENLITCTALGQSDFPPRSTHASIETFDAGAMRCQCCRRGLEHSNLARCLKKK